MWKNLSLFVVVISLGKKCEAQVFFFLIFCFCFLFLDRHLVSSFCFPSGHLVGVACCWSEDIHDSSRLDFLYLAWPHVQHGVLTQAKDLEIVREMEVLDVDVMAEAPSKWSRNMGRLPIWTFGALFVL